MLSAQSIVSPPDRCSEMQPPPPPTAPGAHDAGIDYGVLAPDIAADNMAAHIAAKADQEMCTERFVCGIAGRHHGGMSDEPKAIDTQMIDELDFGAALVTTFETQPLSYDWSSDWSDVLGNTPIPSWDQP